MLENGFDCETSKKLEQKVLAISWI